MVQTFNSKKFSRELKVERITYRITLRTLGKLTKVSAATICRIENGQVPEMKNFLRLCSWLEMPAGDFITTKE